MNWFKKLTTETVLDVIKDYYKIILVSVVGFLLSVMSKTWNKINNISLNISLPIIILIFTVLIAVILLAIKFRIDYLKLTSSIKELINSKNDNVDLFKVGEIVAHKSQKTQNKPEQLTVSKIDINHVHCRNGRGLVTKYAPEELLTKEETQTLLDNIAKKEKEFWGRIGS